MAEEVKEKVKPRRRSRNSAKKKQSETEPVEVKESDTPVESKDNGEKVTDNVDHDITTDTTPVDETDYDSDNEKSTDLKLDTVDEDKKDSGVDVSEQMPTIDTNSPEYIKSVINDPDNTTKDILEKLKNSSLINHVTARIERFIYKTNGKTTPEETVALHYGLFTLFMDIINEQNYGMFVLKLDLLNKVIENESKRNFNEIALSTYDYLWSWGKDKNLLYHKLVVLLTNTAKRNTRKKALATIDLQTIVNDKLIKNKQNLVRYYS